MRAKSFGLPVVVASTFCVSLSSAHAADAEFERKLNHWGLRGKFGFNLKTDFMQATPATAASLPPDASAGPNVAREYQDGFVRPDAANGGLGQTWYWGYQNASQYNPAGNGGQGTIAMHASSSVGTDGTATSGKSGTELGFELSYGRDLGTWGKSWWGLEAAVGMLTMGINKNFSGAANTSDITDLYNLGGSIAPGDPYAGSSGGPGVTVDILPLSRNTVLTTGEIAGKHKLDATMISLRLGPYIELPVSKRWSLSLSAGPALVFLDADYSFAGLTTNDGGLTFTPSAGSGSDTSVLFGFYADARAHYALDEQWSIFAGAQFTHLSDAEVIGGTSKAKMRLGAGIYLEVGVGYTY